MSNKAYSKTSFNQKEILEQHKWFDFIYNESLNGYLKIRSNSTKTQRFAHISNMRDSYKYSKQINARYFTTDNLYISLCTYKTPENGTQANISAVQGFQIDIDYKKFDQYKERSSLNMVSLLEFDYINKGIPVPNIIEVGNNIRLIYVFSEPVGATTKSLALINKVIRFFTLKVKDLGGDIQTVNSAIRVCNSVNTKNDSTVKYYLYSEYKYSLQEIQEEWLDEYYRKEKIKIKKPKEKHHLTTSNILPFKKNYLSLAYNRALDLESIVDMRNGDCEGLRAKIIFYYKNFLLCSGINKSLIDEKVADLNDKFKKPLKKSEIKNSYLDRRKVITTNSGASNELYLVSNYKLIEELGIKDEEQKYLKTIISKTEKNTRRKKRSKEYYEKHRVGLSREEKKIKTLEEIRFLRQRGYTQKEIAKSLDLGIATIKRYWKET